MAQTSNKALQRMDEIIERQHQHEVTNAVNYSMASRVDALEIAFRELHVEGERNKARFQTFRWLLHGAWAAGLAVAGFTAWMASQLSFGAELSARPLPAPQVQTTSQQPR